MGWGPTKLPGSKIRGKLNQWKNKDEMVNSSKEGISSEENEGNFFQRRNLDRPEDVAPCQPYKDFFLLLKYLHFFLFQTAMSYRGGRKSIDISHRFLPFFI